MTDNGVRPSPSPPLLASVLLGVGLGAFVDGIVLHQLLQWHHMLSATDRYPTRELAGLEANTVADGAFHAVALVIVTIASVLMVANWRAGRRAPSWIWFTGALLVGWGAFNVVEGLVNHHILGVHHVRDDVDDPTPWNLGFLAASLALIAIGVALIRSGALHGAQDRSTRTWPETTDAS